MSVNKDDYDLLSGILIIMAIASAFMFDSGIVSHMAAGSIGIISGVSVVLLGIARP